MKLFVVAILCATGIFSINALPTDQHRADVSDIDILAVSEAVKTGNVDRFRDLIRGHDINEKYGGYGNLIHYAAEHGDVEIVEVLIESGADVNTPDENGLTPLHFSALNPNEKVIELLIQKGADVNKTNKKLNSPAHLAAINTNEKVIEQLLKNGADLTKNNDEEETALHWASVNPNEKVADLLIKKGIDMEQKNDDGETALHTSALNSNEKVAGILIKGGADVNALGEDGWTPIFYAVLNGNEAFANMTEEPGLSYEKQKAGKMFMEHFDHPVHGTNKKMIELLLNNGANINQVGSDGTTPYDLSVTFGDMKLAGFLQKRGATPTAEKD